MSEDEQLSFEIGQRDEILDRLAQKGPAGLRDACMRAIRRQAATMIPFNSDDVRKMLQAWNIEVPEGYNAMGSHFSAAAKGGLIRRYGGKRPTNLKGGHGRSYDLWVGTPKAAVAW